MKKAFVKRALLVMTASVMATSLLACKKEEAPQQAGNKEVVKPTSINIMTDIFMTEEAGRAEFLEKFKEKSGIELKLTQPAHNQYYEKVNLAFASGDVPDVVEVGGTALVNYGSNGALYDLTDLVAKSTTLKTVDPKYLESSKIGGKIYIIPNTAGGGTVTYVRQDWMDANNLKAPTTYAEFTNVLKVFAADPDKNGKNDTIGISLPGFISDDPTVPAEIYSKDFFQDATPDFTKDASGKFIDGMLQPNMKAALQRLADAYKAGLIDKETVTNKTSTVRDKFYAGQVGMFNYWAGMWNKTLQDNVIKVVPTAKVAPLNAIKEVKYIERSTIGLAITSKAKNPEGIFKYLLEYVHDGGEGQMMFTHGIEGIHYEMKDGKLVKLPGKNDPKVLFQKVYFSPELPINTWKDPYVNSDLVTNSLNVLKKDGKIVNLNPASDALNRYNADLLILKKEVISKAAMGQMTVDDALAKYAKDAKAMSEEILAELNKK